MNTPDQAQRLMQTQRQLAYIKSEMNGSINTIRIRDNAVLLIDILEYLFFGTATSGDPNFIPGTPASSLVDTSATRVEFTSGPGAVAAAQEQQRRQAAASQPFSPTLPAFAPPPAPAEPVRNGDTQFVRTAPPSASVTFGAPNPSGQHTEYFDAQGRPVNAQGQLIDGNGNVIPVDATPVERALPEAIASLPIAGVFPSFQQAPAQTTQSVPPPMSRESLLAANPIPLAE